MNPRQRRGLLFVILAGVLAVIVFIVVVGYIGNVSSQVGNMKTVYRAAANIPSYSKIEEGSVVAEEVPERWISDSVVLKKEELVGQRVAVNLEKGTMLSHDMLVPQTDLSSTEREIAINVDAVTGVAGRIQTGDYVDIYAVFSEQAGLVPQVRVLVQNVRVVSVSGVQTVVDENSDTGQQDVIPVTLALEPNDALAVSYADAFADAVRLVGLPQEPGGGDRTGEQREFDGADLAIPPVEPVVPGAGPEGGE